MRRAWRWLGWAGRADVSAWPGSRVFKCLAAWPARARKGWLCGWQLREDALGKPQSLLLHAGEGRAGSVPDLCPLAEGPFLQDKVIVGGRVHGVEHVGVVRDLQLWSGRGRESAGLAGTPRTAPLESPQDGLGPET